MSAPLARLWDVTYGSLSIGRLLMRRHGSFDPHGDGRLFGRKRCPWLDGMVRVLGLAGKDAAQQADLEQDSREGIKRGGVASLGSLHRDAEAERGFRDAVIEQDYPRDDLQIMTLNAFEGAFNVMNEDDGVLKRVQPVGADASAEAEPSEDAGQAPNIDRDTEVTPQQSTRVRAIGAQVRIPVLLAAGGYELQIGVTGAIIHACTSARSRVQSCRKEAGPSSRSEASAFAHGAQCVRWLPERRSQMLPQRSQYFSSMLRNCGDSDATFIVFCPPAKKSPPLAEGEDCRSWTPGKDHASAGDRARLVCDDLFVINWKRRVPVLDLPLTEVRLCR